MHTHVPVWFALLSAVVILSSWVSVTGKTSTDCDLLDVVLVLDGSGSIDATEYEDLRAFAHNIADSFDVALGKVHMGVVEFTSYAVVVQGLTTNKTEVLEEIDTMGRIYYVYEGQIIYLVYTHIGEGIAEAQQMLFDTSEGSIARPEARKLMILLTDGVEQDTDPPENPNPRDPYTEAANAKGAGTQLFVLGVGDETDTTFMDTISSQPPSFFRLDVDSFDVLPGRVEELIRGLCTRSVTTVAQVCVDSPTTSYLDIAGTGFPATNVLCKFNNTEFSPSEVFQAQSEAVVLSDTEMRCPIPPWNTGGPMRVTIWEGENFLFEIGQTFRYLTCNELACKLKVNMVLLLDGSGSINTLEFEQMRTFAADMLTQLELGENAVEIGVLQYGTVPRVEAPLGSDAVTVVTNLEDMERLPEGSLSTAIGYALKEGQRHLTEFSRLNAMKIMILLTDGRESPACPDCEYDPIVESAAAKAAGTIILGIGVGDSADVDYTALESYCSGSEHVFRVEEGFEELSERVDDIVRSLCPEVISITPTSTCLGGGTLVVITGKGFADTSSIKCKFGDLTPVDAVFVSPTEVRCSAPASISAGDVTVEVAIDGEVFTEDSVTFTYEVCEPSISRCAGAQDVVILLDGSASLSDDAFAAELEFASDFSNEFDIGATGTNIGVIQFGAAGSQGLSTIISLSDNPHSITQAIEGADRLSVSGQGGGALAQAIHSAHDMLTTSGRSESEKFIILVTDGVEDATPTDDPYYVQDEADLVREAGIILYSVVVGNEVDVPLLLNLVAQPASSHMYQSAATFEELATQVDAVAASVDRAVLLVCYRMEVSVAQVCEDSTTTVSVNIFGVNFPSTDLICRFNNTDFVLEDPFLHDTPAVYVSDTEIQCPLPPWNKGGPVRISLWRGTELIADLAQTFRYLTCEKTACNIDVDIILLLDGSGSINTLEFEQMKIFAADMLTQFEMGPDAIQIGVVQYGSMPREEVAFPSDTALEGIAELVAMPRLSVIYRNTAIGHALNFAQDILETRGRADAMNMIMLLTDGRQWPACPGCAYDPLTESAAAKAAGTVIFGIGVGDSTDVDYTALESYCSLPGSEHVFRVEEGFEALPGHINEIITALCPSVFTVTPVTGCLEGGSIITIRGKAFTDTSNAKCKFGDLLPITAEFISSEELHCIAPVTTFVGPVSIEVAINGVVFTEDDVTFNYENCSDAVTGCPGPQDIVFLLDGSTNLDATEFNIQRRFASRLANAFPLKESETHIGAVQFGDASNIRTELSLSSDRRAITTGLEGMEWLNVPGTAIGDAIHMAHEVLMQGRQNSTKFIVLVTNGNEEVTPGTDLDPVTEAKKVKEDGVILLGIGVGADANMTRLKELVTQPVDGFALPIQEFDQLITNIDTIVSSLCPGILSVSPASVCEGESASILVRGHGFHSGELVCKIGEFEVASTLVNSSVVYCYINTSLHDIQRGEYPVSILLADGSVYEGEGVVLTVAFCPVPGGFGGGGSGDNTGIIAGAIIGALLLLLLLLWLLWRYCKRKPKKVVAPAPLQEEAQPAPMPEVVTPAAPEPQPAAVVPPRKGSRFYRWRVRVGGYIWAREGGVANPLPVDWGNAGRPGDTPQLQPAPPSEPASSMIPPVAAPRGRGYSNLDEPPAEPQGRVKCPWLPNWCCPGWRHVPRAMPAPAPVMEMKPMESISEGTSQDTMLTSV